ncbi:hypothetical protein ACHAO8_011439 [Botrytis cinerea]
MSQAPKLISKIGVYSARLLTELGHKCLRGVDFYTRLTRLDHSELDDCPADAHRWEFLDIQFYNGGDGQYHREVPPCISVWAELIGFVEGDLFTVLVYALSLTAFELEGCIEADYKAAIVLGEHAIGVNIAGHSLYPENVGSFGNFEGNRPIIEVGYQLGLASGYIDVYC